MNDAALDDVRSDGTRSGSQVRRLDVPSPAETFARDVVSVFGLPFDAIDLVGAVERIRGAAFAHRRCFVSTPNVNFAVAALEDADFRRSVCRSDLVLADGTPIVELARRQGTPLREIGRAYV